MGEEWVEYYGGAVQEDRHLNASRIRVAAAVTVIPEEAFWGSRKLRTVDLNNVSTISASAFQDCHLLERVVWTTAASVEIREAAFYGCRSLREIDLSNVTKIGARAFKECTALAR